MKGNQSMGDQYGGKRKGAGRKKGSKNKTTIAREVIGEIIDAPDPMKLASAIHQRGTRQFPNSSHKKTR